MQKKYKVKDVKATRYNGEFHQERINGELTLIKKYSRNGVEKCLLESDDGWECIINADNLEEIKMKSNKKSKK